MPPCGRNPKLKATICGLLLFGTGLFVSPASGEPADAPKTETAEPAPKRAPVPAKEPAPETKPAESEPAKKAERRPDPDPEPEVKPPKREAPKREPQLPTRTEPEPGEPSRKTPRREKETRPAVRKEPPPADETGSTLPDELRQGIADSFPPINERLLPGFPQAEEVRYLHLGDERPAPVVAPAKLEDVPPGPTVWERLTERFGSDRTLVNVIVLAALVVIFGLYRLRAGRSRYP